MIQVSDKGNSVVHIDKDVYVKSIDSVSSDKAEFENFDTKKDLLSLIVNHKKHIGKYLKSLKLSRTGSVEQHKKIKERL